MDPASMLGMAVAAVAPLVGYYLGLKAGGRPDIEHLAAGARMGYVVGRFATDDSRDEFERDFFIRHAGTVPEELAREFAEDEEIDGTLEIDRDALDWSRS